MTTYNLKHCRHCAKSKWRGHTWIEPHGSEGWFVPGGWACKWGGRRFHARSDGPGKIEWCCR